MRIAGLAEALAARGVEVVDRCNLAGPVNPWQAPDHGYRHLDEVVAWNRELMHATMAELKLGRMPIMLGGDHCLGVGSITAVARPPDTALGSRFAGLGGVTAAAASTAVTPSRVRNRCSPRTAARDLATELEASASRPASGSAVDNATRNPSTCDSFTAARSVTPTEER